jgi:hypothetical protein
MTCMHSSSSPSDFKYLQFMKVLCNDIFTEKIYFYSDSAKYRTTFETQQ